MNTINENLLRELAPQVLGADPALRRLLGG
jgi:hypothetical protein